MITSELLKLYPQALFTQNSSQTRTFVLFSRGILFIFAALGIRS